ncbi:MAG: hypothetical protein ACREPL_00745 [Rhodanobacteraceae bacterium]
MRREFLRFGEAVKGPRGDEEALRQAIIFHRLPVYVELNGSECELHLKTEAFPKEGSNAFSCWYDVSCFSDDPHETVKDGPFKGYFLAQYALTGWFRVQTESATEIAREHGGEARFIRVEAEYTDGSIARFSLDRSTSLQDLWLRSDDIDKLMAAPPQPVEPNCKPLDARERANALRVIRALAVMANMPDRGAAPSIEKQLQVLGFNGPRDATIRKLLGEARALEPDDKPQLRKTKSQ